MNDPLVQAAVRNLRDILRECFAMDAKKRALIIFDDQAPLTRILTDAYRQALPNAQFVDFAGVTPERAIELIDALSPGDLVVLVQSNNFRLNEFRFRIEIFKRGLATIEHVHLERLPENEFATYIEALAYDKAYYRTLGPALKRKLDSAKRTVVECEGTELVYGGPLEETKLNIGDYAGMKNAGGMFPIGEVFTEAKDLRTVNGRARIFAFAGNDHVVKMYPPFMVIVTDGILTAPDSPPEFQEILERIKLDEEVLVRELGLGLNRAMGKDRPVADVNAFERQRGVHLSLGGKHAVYAKPGLGRKKGRYHVDIFVDVTRMTADGEVLFENGTF